MQLILVVFWLMERKRSRIELHCKRVTFFCLKFIKSASKKSQKISPASCTLNFFKGGGGTVHIVGVKEISGTTVVLLCDFDDVEITKSQILICR